MADYRRQVEAQFPYLVAEGKHDHKAWAKRIMYRDEKGDTTLTSIQAQFAKMAMGLLEQPGAK